MSGEGWSCLLPRFLSQSHHVGHLYTEQPWRHHIHCTMCVSLTLPEHSAEKSGMGVWSRRRSSEHPDHSV